MNELSPDLLKIKVGETIRHKRELKGWSREHLADLLDVDYKTLRNLENGISFLSPAMVCKLVSVFNLPPKAFLDIELKEELNDLQRNDLINKIRTANNETFNLYYRVINAIDGAETYEQK